MNHGHYGQAATISAIAIGAAVLAQLLLPFAVVEYPIQAGDDPRIYRFFEAADAYEEAADAMSPLTWSVGLLWIGLVLAAIGALMLVVMGQQPLEVDAARWIGATGGLVLIIGAALIAMPAWYHIGSGFATFSTRILGGEFRGQTWAVSPVVSGVAALVAAHQGLGIMTRVTTTRDGIRDRATKHADLARGGFALLALILFVPWSLGVIPSGIADGSFLVSPQDNDKSAFFFSAQDVQGATLAELSPGGAMRFASEDDWRWLKLGIDGMLIGAWALIVLGLLGAFIGTARSVGGPSAMDGLMRLLAIPAAIAALVAAVGYLAAWFTFTPRPDSGLFLPGFWPALIAIAAIVILRARMRPDDDSDTNLVIST